MTILLISTYDMGRQPFGLASPAAWLRAAGFAVRCLDLAVEELDEQAVRSAHLVGFFVPMHMATRLALGAIERIRGLNPTAHLCFYGLYAAENASYLRRLGVDSILGGEFEASLMHLAQRLCGSETSGRCGSAQAEPPVSLERLKFRVPDRSGLPELRRYAHLVTSEGRSRTVGYVEASRGCKHLCRHCPIVPVYGGRFRIVQREVVLADIRQQVQAGAEHVTFGDPDFFNGPGHAIPLVTALHEEHPELTYDVTIKVEHLARHQHWLPILKETGCLFITTAVESFDERILALFDKRHSREDFEQVLSLCRSIGLPLVPTFVAFTPWTTMEGYRSFLSEIARLGLVDSVTPIQYAIRLLIPPGSKLLDLAEIQEVITGLDEAKLSYTWQNPDPKMDDMQRDLERLVQARPGAAIPRPEMFRAVWDRAHRETNARPSAAPFPDLPPPSAFVPYLTEPWYC